MIFCNAWKPLGPAAADPGRHHIGGAVYECRRRGMPRREAVTAWGVDTQINQCMEECAELVAALNPLSARGDVWLPMWPGNLPTTGGQYR